MSGETASGETAPDMPGAPGLPSSMPPSLPPVAAHLADGEWHRLHWASPLLKGGFVLVAVLAFILTNLRERLVELFIPTGPGPGDGGGGGSGGGGQGGRGNPGDNGDIVSLVYSHGQTGIAILIIFGVILVAIAAFALAWRMHSFRIGSDAVEVKSGVLFRHNRQARLDRIQGIHITRPLFARLFGAARIELTVAGQDAKVELAYLGSSQVDELRREILRRASGVLESEARAAAQAADDAGVGATVGDASDFGSPEPRPGILNRRLGEFLAPELDPDAAPPESVVKITPLRLIGSLVLSEFTVVLLLVIAALVVSTVFAHHTFILFLLLPSVIGSLGYYSRRFTKSLRYSIAGTPDGVRVGFGLFTINNDTLPPGRIHAIEVTQPILWRPAGWWMIRINRAGHASSHGGAGQPHTLLLPVGRVADVERVLGLLLPGLAVASPTDASDQQQLQRLVLAGLTARHGAGFSSTPARGFWLRPLSWRRTGFAVTPDAVLLRTGFVWRRLSVVPLARLQSLHVTQGPVRRVLDLAALDFNTIAGPVRAKLGVIDRRAAVAAFTELSAGAVLAARADDSHRWAGRATPALHASDDNPLVPLLPTPEHPETDR
ncbi:PH domain-containing protein [Subtercola sp. RTI3]|uniref:PH domain-containing protein n=1 Tax=Subtercola sp. RTI3 TaxID=3048639 RepID=UPI002B23A338|nr:PH domain-containing protein [Subtercola sp. RTI3]MEA9984926.1 PH domain-containing protein [Subtercola sp. RTI3]